MRITKTAVNLFDDWALSGRDKGMEVGHLKSADRMIKIITEKIREYNKFSVLDIGCGNGWMLRRILGQILNSRGLGVDGSINMIKNAVERDPEGNYLCTNLNSWRPTEKYNLIISMEVMYYLENPKEFIKSLFHCSLKNRGVFIFGIDHYAENKASLSWPKNLGVTMKTLSIDQWINIFYHAGFEEVCHEQFNHKENWEGTLIISGIKNS